MSKLGSSFAESYSNFFKFFSDSSKSISEINTFISTNSLKNYSNINKINLNMIDLKNLNILFHIIRKSKSDDECLEKLKLLIEQYNIDYNLFDINQRTLPFYTCVKGYLNSTKYLLELMDYKIERKDIKGETLFFSAIRSYNIELVKYLDRKYEGWIFDLNSQYNSCIFNIFKKAMKDEGEKKIKNIMKFIVERGFNIDESYNNSKVSFRDLCINYQVDKYLNEILNEKNLGRINIIKKNEEINEIKKNNDVNVNADNNKKSSNKKIIINGNINEEEVKNINPVINSNSSSKLLVDNSSNSKLIQVNGDINKDNNNKEIKNIPKQQKKICCVFVDKNMEKININKVYEKFVSFEHFKTNYFNRMKDNI